MAVQAAMQTAIPMQTEIQTETQTATGKSAKIGKMGNTKEAIADWDRRTLELWSDIKTIMASKPNGSGEIPKGAFRAFVVFSARLLNDVQQFHAFLDELYGVVEQPDMTWDRFYAYLIRPDFEQSLAMCAKHSKSPYLPTFDYFRDFVAPPNQELLTDVADKANSDEFEREEPEFRKQSAAVLGVDVATLDSNQQCHSCGSRTGISTGVQTRSADEGQAMVFRCGKRNCGLTTKIDKDE